MAPNGGPQLLTIPHPLPPIPYSALRSNSLMPIFARVCASTRLTITAQYSLYLPFAAGRLSVSVGRVPID